MNRSLGAMGFATYPDGDTAIKMLSTELLSIRISKPKSGELLEVEL
jgi:hypothetical protein